MSCMGLQREVEGKAVMSVACSQRKEKRIATPIAIRSLAERYEDIFHYGDDYYTSLFPQVQLPEVTNNKHGCNK